MQEHIVYLLSASCSVIGFFISYRIFQKKKVAGPLICPLRANCERVIRSSHSKFLGVPLEKFGMLYHALGLIFYISASFFAYTIHPNILFVASIATLFGFMLSMYLIAVQVFVLKSWCSWCMTSALVSILNFILIFFVSNLPIIELLETHRRIILIAHVLAVVVGMGGAFMSDFLFFRFLKDYKISDEEHDTLESISGIIWLAIIVIIVSGIAIYLPKIAIYNATPKFLAKMTIVGIITINGFLLGKIVSPKLTSLRFDIPKLSDPKLARIRRISFMLGAISMTSWLSAFVLAMLKNIPYSYSQIMGTYGAVLLCAIIGGLIFEYIFTRKRIVKSL